MILNSLTKTLLQLAFFMSAILLSMPTLTEDLVSGRFNLIDHRGESVTESSYNGKLRLVFFGFTQCPDVCPLTLVEVRKALELLEKGAEQIQTLFISVDTERDSLDRLNQYVSAFHPSFVGLTGSNEQIESAAESFRVKYGTMYSESDENQPGEIYHTAYLFLMDRDASFIDLFGFGASAEQIAETLRGYL